MTGEINRNVQTEQVYIYLQPKIQPEILSPAGFWVVKLLGKSDFAQFRENTTISSGFPGNFQKIWVVNFREGGMFEQKFPDQRQTPWEQVASRIINW